MESSSKGELKLVVVGEAGQGKSTLINGLLGKPVATEGEDFDAGTAEIKHYLLNQNGICVKIWDTPGFGFGSKEDDDKMVEQLQRSDCYPPDLALFCFRMDGMRFPTRLHIETMLKLNEVFGEEFWKHILFVLTFANCVQSICPAKEDPEYFFSNRICTLEEKIQGVLRKEVKLPENIISTIRAVPVGSHKNHVTDKSNGNPWTLPDREDWFIWFWIECTEHIRQASLLALLKANYHRIKTVSEEAPPFGQDPPEAFQRNIKTKAPLVEYISAINKSEDIIPHNMGLEEETDSQNIEEEEYKGLEEKPTTIELVGANENFPPEPNENFTTPSCREIPIVEILLHQLDNENSSFYAYAKEFAKQRGSSVWGFGHVGGFFEGLVKWLFKRKRIRH